jgi:hypothetical protein
MPDSVIELLEQAKAFAACGLGSAVVSCIEEALCEYRRLQDVPAYETVKQWEKRTGRKYPETAPIYALDEKVPDTVKPYYFLTTLKIVDKDRRILIVATEAGPPPEDWRPECVK